VVELGLHHELSSDHLNESEIVLCRDPNGQACG
jgi:hypothetical protein